MYWLAATFGWLCVETITLENIGGENIAATFGWLCVETRKISYKRIEYLAATFGWLCVETLLYLKLLGFR